jgi:HNH endonuclease
MRPKKHDPELISVLRASVTLDEATGNLKFDGIYASMHIDIGWKGSVVSVPHSHVVWLMKHGRWPRDGFNLDHENDDPMDNRPDNLKEVTRAENQRKRRGRIVSRAYGRGKYGHGIGVHHDKRDGRYYVTRTLSRGHGNGDLRTVKKGLGGFDTLKEAKRRVGEIIAEIEANGPGHVPAYGGAQPKRKSVRLSKETERMRELRKAGYTFHRIAEVTGFSMTAVYNRCNDIDVDAYPRGKSNTSSKLTESNVREIRRLRFEGVGRNELAERYGVTPVTVHNIVTRKTWTHVT